LKQNGVAFALFTEQSLAINAMDSLNGIQFDPDSSELLRVELAKQNTKRKRAAQESTNPEFFSKERIEKRLRKLTQSSYHNQSAFSGGMYGLPFGGAAALAGYGAYGVDPFAAALSMQLPQQSYSPRRDKGGVSAPCGTLFVSNLSADVDEGELLSVFSRLEGFIRMQLYRKRDLVNAFVQFKDASYSAQAINSAQGTILASNARGPIHIEFARNEMVLRSDLVVGEPGSPLKVKH